MNKIIQSTKNLFSIEGMNNGQVQIKTSKYLLSLPEDKQIEVLTAQLIKLKTELAEYDSPARCRPTGKNDEVDKTQLKVLIQVIEVLLDRI